MKRNLDYNDEDIIDDGIKALKKVIKDWGIFELLLVVIFVPFSFIYIILRVLQEWE